MSPMDFKTRRIRHHAPPSKITKKIKTGNIKINGPLFTIGLGTLVIVIIIFVLFQIIKSLDFSSLVFSFGEPLQKDAGGKTNILLVGIGGEGHDGPNLTDTLILASIDYNHKLVPMLSIPRDFYLEKKQTRINALYQIGMSQYTSPESLKNLGKNITEITGVPIQYYVKVDFKGFEKMVDDLGGIDVIVENDIYDTSYPIGELGKVETFQLAAGPQHLTGKVALKYARSRHGNTDGDFGRARRQQQILYAMKEKALSLNILDDAGKIKDLYNSISESIETNLSLAEMIELGKLAKDLGKESAVPLVLNYDSTSCSGLLYQPDRSYFSNADVILPAGTNFDYIKFFVSTVFRNPQILEKQEQIQVLNGTKVAGLAYEGMSLLSRFCLNVVYYTNAEDRALAESTIYYKTNEQGEKPVALEAIAILMPNLKMKEGIPQMYLEGEKRKDSVIVIELGQDYLSKRIKDPFNSLRYLAAPQPAPTATTSTPPSATPQTTPSATPTSP